MLNSFLIGRTWESRAPSAVVFSCLWLAGRNVEQAVDSDNDEQKSPTKAILALAHSSDLLAYRWTQRIRGFSSEKSV